MALWPLIEAFNTMAEPDLISGSAFCTVNRTPLTFTLKVSSKNVSVTSPIGINQLLNRECNGAGNRLRRNRHLVHLVDDLRFDFRICHGIREVRVDESRRNARHAELIAGFQSQGLGDGAHGVLRSGIHRHGRHDLNSGSRNDIDEMSETLAAENREGGCDAVKNTFEVDVDHLLPILDTELI